MRIAVSAMQLCGNYAESMHYHCYYHYVLSVLHYIRIVFVLVYILYVYVYIYIYDMYYVYIYIYIYIRKAPCGAQIFGMFYVEQVCFA